MATYSVLLPGKSHGQRSLVGYGTWGHKEAAEWLHFHLHSSDWKIIQATSRDRNDKGKLELSWTERVGEQTIAVPEERNQNI